VSNFMHEYEKGQAGGNRGLPMGPGLAQLDRYIGGVQRRMTYVIASAPKVGKSTLTDYAFLVQPYLHAVDRGLNVRWIYFSFEIDRVSKEFDIASHFLHADHGIYGVGLDHGITVDGKGTVPLSSAYLRGRLMDDGGNTVKVKPEVEQAMRLVYHNRISPLFGMYSPTGERLTEGYVDFVEDRDNPTGLYSYLREYAKRNGEFHLNAYGRTLGYTPKDPTLHTIVITDHLRKLKPERNFTMKQNVDKYSEYQVELRNWCGFTFVNIIHTNRSLGAGDNIKFYGSELYPTSENIKDTSNLSEDADHVITLFDPNDDRYRLDTHFGLKLRNPKGSLLWPRLRTIHLVESRHSESPKHFKAEMLGNVKTFRPLDIGGQKPPGLIV